MTAGAALLLLLLFGMALMPNGGMLFTREGCSGCHRLRGSGGMAGPDLSEVSKRRSRLWIMRQIRNPRSHNPDSRMPVFENLDCLELWALMRYVTTPQ